MSRISKLIFLQHSVPFHLKNTFLSTQIKSAWIYYHFLFHMILSEILIYSIINPKKKKVARKYYQ